MNPAPAGLLTIVPKKLSHIPKESFPWFRAFFVHEARAAPFFRGRNAWLRMP